MIVGIGCDLANINRFEKALAKFGGRFVNRAFSEREKAELARRERLSEIRGLFRLYGFRCFIRGG